MTYIQLGLGHWYRGKRVRKYYTKPFDISDSLWEALYNFAQENELCSIGKWDYDKDKLYMHRLTELDEVLKEYCNAPEDYKMFHNIQTEMFGGFVHIMPLQFKYEYSAKVTAVDFDNRKCTIEKTLPPKQLKEWVESKKEFPPVSYIDVALSDRCIYENVKPNDIVLIRKFVDDTFLAVRVDEFYEEQ
ncbi:hypothetical protein [Methanobrevibacter sp.]